MIATNVLIVALGLAGSIIQARILGPEKRGYLAFVFLFPVLMIYFGSIGLQQAVIYQYGFKRNKSFIWTNALCIILALSLLDVSICVFVISLFSSKYPVSIINAAYVYVFVLPFGMISLVGASILQLEENFKSYNKFRIVLPILNLVAILVLWWSKNITILNLTITQLCISVFSCILLLYYFFKIDIIFKKKIISKKEIKNLTKYGLKVWLGDLAQGMNMRSDQMWIAVLLSPINLGFYVVGNSVANFLSIIGTSYRSKVFSGIVKLNSKDEKLSFLSNIYKDFSIINLSASSLFAIIIIPLIPLLYGNQYKNSVIIACILCGSYFFQNLKSLYSAASQGLGYPALSSLAELIGLISLAILAPLFIYFFSLLGLAIGILLSSLTSYIFLKRSFVSKLSNE